MPANNSISVELVLRILVGKKCQNVRKVLRMLTCLRNARSMILVQYFTRQTNRIIDKPQLARLVTVI